MKNILTVSSFLFLLFFANSCKTLTHSGSSEQPVYASKPLFRDTIYDGAADPVVIWNDQEKSWYMFYTNRRAKLIKGDLKDVSWVHGTPIGIAESKDNGATWHYKADAIFGYTDGNDSTTFWAPEIIFYNGIYHMYLTIVPGIFSDWKHPRYIIHLTSNNLLVWKFESKLPLATEKVIDACVMQLKDGTWRLWYNNESDGKSIYYADSKDLYQWQDKGKIIRDGGKSCEGPNVFYWQDKYFMIVDEWRGLGVFSSNDAITWTRQADRILDVPGTGNEDGVNGQHADIVINNNKAYIFYFTHPGKANPENSSFEKARSLIQVAELEYIDGQIRCDRNKPVEIHLSNPNKQKK